MNGYTPSGCGLVRLIFPQTGSTMVDNGRHMAWVLYTDPTGILQEYMGARPFPGHSQAIPRQFPSIPPESDGAVTNR